jgi:hypothetical protein
MRTERELTQTVAVPAVLLALLFSTTAALPADPATGQSAEAADSQLNVGSKLVKGLTLVEESGKYRVIDRPGESLTLPAGKYRLEEIELQGDYRSCRFRGSGGQWFELTPDRPHQLRVDGLLSPTVDVTRQGRLLELSYSLADVNGATYSYRDSGNPPQFRVYKGGQEIGSGSFEYG